MSVQIDPGGLHRFQICGFLGEGADCQVFAATDLERNAPVVVKRPHPMLIARGQHTDVERRLRQSLELRPLLDDAARHVAAPVAHAVVPPGDGYFGDTHDHPYLAVVEERARGLPLVGSATDGIRRMPIGLPQQLFALHPVARHKTRDRFSVALDVLEVAESFLAQGLVLLDARPQNVFFDPRDATVTIIDTGGATPPRAATRRRAALDAHDFYTELLKWHLPTGEPPSAPEGYAQPQGMESVSRFAQDLAALKRAYQAMPCPDIGESGAALVERVRERGYGAPPDFRADFEQFITMYRSAYDKLALHHPTMQVWTQARGKLSSPYWRKFLFDAERDMAAYPPETNN